MCVVCVKEQIVAEITKYFNATEESADAIKLREAFKAYLKGVLISLTTPKANICLKYRTQQLNELDTSFVPLKNRMTKSKVSRCCETSGY